MLFQYFQCSNNIVDKTLLVIIPHLQNKNKIVL